VDGLVHGGDVVIRGGHYVYCDTDSLFIVATNTAVSCPALAATVSSTTARAVTALS
jgi:hypothetical protein